MKNFILLLLAFSATTMAFAQRKINLKNTDRLTLAGDARAIDGNLQLTPAEHNKSGAVWLSEKVEVANGFTTTFKFRTIDNGGSNGGADGIAFVIQNDPYNHKIGHKGEGIGYAGITNSLAVEFDTYDNNEGSNNHIAIHANQKGKSCQSKKYSLGINHDIPDLKQGTHTAKITYKDEVFAVDIDGKNVLAIDIALDEIIDLFEGKAYVGFTSATAGGYAQHDILDWSFSNQKEREEIVVYSKKDRIERPTVEPDSDRQIVTKRTITVNSEVITLKVWDHNRRDGDIISLNLNNRWLVQNYMLNKKPMTFQIPLSEGDNLLSLHAINLGSIPPNTASIRVIDGDTKEEIVLNSDLDKSEGVVIRYNND